MQFHSFEFILFFIPVVIAGFSLCGRLSANACKVWLITASLVFYCREDPRAAAVLAPSILFNYLVSLRLGPDHEKSGVWLRLALAFNVLALGVFKYSSFTVSNAAALVGAHWSLPAIILPLGISFFTVQQIMFLVDRHEGLTPRPRLIDYGLFVSFFPYIVAGPITRWKDVVPQLPEGRTSLRSENVARGVSLFVPGLAKKVILSSAFAHIADPGFADPYHIGIAGAWLAPAAFALQLYYDFSGYTDMARGVASMLNVTLPENFNNPFRSLSITEFWQRWHITLTNFLTNYLYTPILRARRPTFRRAIYATIITMTIAGIWHGAGIGFALFGLWHGIGLAVNTAWRRRKRELPVAVARTLVIVFLLIGFTLFRAHTLGESMFMIRSMFAPASMAGAAFTAMIAGEQPTRVVALVVGIALPFWPATSSEAAARMQLRPRLAFALAVCFVVTLITMNSQPVTGFIYRQF